MLSLEIQQQIKQIVSDKHATKEEIEEAIRELVGDYWDL